MASTRAATDDDIDACVAVLAQLPEHFTPDTHDDLRATMPGGLGRVAEDAGQVVGFILATRRYRRSAEITYAAVAPDRRRQGVGTALVHDTFAALAAEGVVAVEVKTLDASSPYPPYEATRAFWEALGFVQIDCIDPLPGWQPGNPSAIYVAALAPSAGRGVS